MVANIGPASYNYEETLGTLRYANRAKNIKNVPRINEDPKDALLREFQVMHIFHHFSSAFIENLSLFPSLLLALSVQWSSQVFEFDVLYGFSEYWWQKNGWVAKWCHRRLAYMLLRVKKVNYLYYFILFEKNCPALKFLQHLEDFTMLS